MKGGVWYTPLYSCRTFPHQQLIQILHVLLQIRFEAFVPNLCIAREHC